MGLIRYLKSFLREELVERTSSAVNPVLEVHYANGQYELNTQHANYSFGSLHHVFVDTFREFGISVRKPGSVLLLGLGAGSVVRILRGYGLESPITGVELDPVVIALAEKYFGLKQQANLEVVQADATAFVQEDHLKYDLVVVDLFIDNLVPAEAETPQFLEGLRKRLSPNGILFFNRMVETAHLAERTRHFEELFALFFPAYKSYRTLENRVFVQDNLLNFGAAPQMP